MIVHLILFTLVLAVDAQRSLECSLKGPKYWCRNRETADKCHAVAYCEKYIWPSTGAVNDETKSYVKFETKSLASGSNPNLVSSTCTLCQEGIGTLRLLLSNKERQKEVIAAVKSACTALPASYQAYCKSSIESYASTIIDAILTYTQDPRPLCRRLHLCTKNANLVKVDAKKFPFSRKCDVCKYASELLGAFLKIKDVQKRVMVVVLDVCRHMPLSYEAVCTSLVESNFDAAIKFIIGKLENPSDLCEEFRLCAPVGVVRYKPLGSIQCSICEYTAEGLGGVLASKKTQGEVKELLLNYCEQLPPSLQNTCTSIVLKNFDAALKFFIEKLENPKDFCVELGLCTGFVTKATNVMKTFSSIECDVCIYSAEGMSGILENKESQKEVKDALLAFCEQLPLSLKSSCAALIENNFNTAVKFWIEKLKNPDDVCKEFGMCSSTRRLEKHLAKDKPVTCEVCELLILKLDNMLKNNKTGEAVKTALEKLCADLPWSLQCTQLIDQYAAEITRLMISQLDPAKICTALKLCASLGVNHVFPRVSDSKDLSEYDLKKDDVGVDGDVSMMQRNGMTGELPTCNLCMFMSGRIDSLLWKSHRREKVKDIIKTICSRSNLSEEKREECHRLLDEHIDMIVKFATNSQLPTLCKEIGQCVSGFNVTYNEGNDLRGGTGCIVCEYLIGVLDTFLMKKTTKSEIIAVVHNFCNKLPRRIFVTECNALVSEYGEEIIQLFVDDVLAPVDICQHFGVC